VIGGYAPWDAIAAHVIGGYAPWEAIAADVIGGYTFPGAIVVHA